MVRYLSPSEASELLCPFAMNKPLPTDLDVDGEANCRVGKCMAWQWDDAGYGQRAHTEGYCTLVGQRMGRHADR